MKKIEIASLVILGLLFFVWPVPHTVTLRDLLLASNLLVFGYLTWVRGGSRVIPRGLSVPAILLAGLTAWMYFVAYFISPESGWSFDEISSQWWRALAAAVAGVLVATAAGGNPRLTRGVLAVLLVALAAHILYVDFQAVHGWLASGSLERVAGLTEGPDKSNYLTNVLFGFLLAEFFFRAVLKRQILPLPNAVLAAALALAVVSVFAERTRNGIITLVLMLLLLGWCYLRERRGRLSRLGRMSGAAAMIAVVLAGLGLVVAARQSTSLDNLIETIPVAWDTEHYRAWQEENPVAWPILPNGEAVDPSLYQRIAWFKEGLLLVRDHPWGVGFGRNAFGHGLNAKYGRGGGHSHSGLLDMAIGLGIPGALLWLGFFASLATVAWRRHRASASYPAILLLLLLIDYGVRMLLDSVIRDHMLQQFMFLAGLAAVLTVADVPEQRKASA